jgi:hypothetical protein
MNRRVSDLQLQWTRTTNKRNECEFPKFIPHIYQKFVLILLSLANWKHSFVLIHQGQEAYAEHPKEKAKEDLCAVGSGGSNEGDHAEQSCSPCVDLRLQ